MQRKKITILLLALLLMVLSSCSNTSEMSTQLTPTPEKVAKDTPGNNELGGNAPVPTPTSVEKPFVFPSPGTRPYAVMIDNEGTRPLPQGGLNQAQIIYEIIVEGGATRLMAVFWGTEPSMIGPVRSSRHYFLDYAMEHDAIYVHFGWSPMAQRDISKFKINNINGVGYGGEVYWDLTNDPSNWQDSYTSMEKVKNFVQKAKYPTDTKKELVFTYNQKDAGLETDQKAEKVDIKYNQYYSVAYEYDSNQKIYKKFRSGKPHMERVSDSQLKVKNIIIQNMRNYRIPGDTQDRQELVDVGNGSGWHITDGKAIKINWSKASRTAPTKYTDEAGNNIKINPGLTWVQIVPLSGKVDIQ